MFPNQTPLTYCLAEAVDDASFVIARDFLELEQLQVTRKAQADFVSKTDLKVERILVRKLSKSRPDFGFITEEKTTNQEQKEFTFVIDPIDGTSNFIHGIPHFCISIGVLREDSFYAGLICDPIKNEYFWAEKGKGAWLNGKRIRPSGKVNDDELICSASLHCDQGQEDHLFEVIKKANKQVCAIRLTGSAALDFAYVAAGRFDSCYLRNNKIWDLAAGLAILSEAGCKTYTDRQSKEDLKFKTVFAAQPGKFEFLKSIFVDNQ